MRKGIKKEQVTLKLRFPRQQHLMPALCSCSQVLLLTRGCNRSSNTAAPRGQARHSGFATPRKFSAGLGPSLKWHGWQRGLAQAGPSHTSDFLSELPCKREPRFLSLKSSFSREMTRPTSYYTARRSQSTGVPNYPK